MIFDIHSHLIPKIDDGSKSIDDSIKMLQILKGEGVDNILATPHFYPETVAFDPYMAARSKSLEDLIAHANGADLPQIHLGCELYYTKGMAKYESLSRLRIAGTDFILIELPYGGISDNVIDDIFNFCSNYCLIPIFAHLERFGLFKGYKKAVSFVMTGNALAQVNASSFFDKKQKKYALALAKQNLISFIGSDMHSPENDPHVRQAIDMLRTTFPACAEKIEASSQMLHDAIINTESGK